MSNAQSSVSAQLALRARRAWRTIFPNFDDSCKIDMFDLRG